jgi:hypothetical protein
MVVVSIGALMFFREDITDMPLNGRTAMCMPNSGTLAPSPNNTGVTDKERSFPGQEGGGPTQCETGAGSSDSI